MSILDETAFIERLQFFNGQRVSAADLQGVEAFNREMRWLHNVSLHQPGIGSGYAVGGTTGDRDVVIKPGYAIDDLGREIVLTQAVVEPIPPVAGDESGNSVFYDLTVSYPDDSELEAAETRDGICLPRGVVRLREAPAFCWVELEMTEEGLSPKDLKLRQGIQVHRRIILAQIEVFNCRLKQPVRIAERLDARPDFGPFIASGKVKFDPPQLKVIDENRSRRTPGLAFTVTIDTTNSGFRTTPCYSAHFEGPRTMPSASPAVSPSEGGGNSPSFGLFDLVHIQDAGPQHFTVDLFLLVIPFETNAGSGVSGRQVTDEPTVESIKKWIAGEWKLVWMGVEG